MANKIKWRPSLNFKSIRPQPLLSQFNSNIRVKQQSITKYELMTIMNSHISHFRVLKLEESVKSCTMPTWSHPLSHHVNCQEKGCNKPTPSSSDTLQNAWLILINWLAVQIIQLAVLSFDFWELVSFDRTSYFDQKAVKLEYTYVHFDGRPTLFTQRVKSVKSKGTTYPGKVDNQN